MTDDAKTVPKARIISAFIAAFEAEVAALSASAKAAHEAATHEESKAEDAHDTRGLEASYLAGAQNARIAELKAVILEYKTLHADAIRPSPAVAAGAVVTVQPLVDADSEKPRGPALHALVAVRGGGTTVEVDGLTYAIFTPTSPIGEAILGGTAGEVVEIESKGGSRAYRIESVA
ncbi:MAG: GreA/GreB family elongation factor [Bdellovibrionales bacterium]|nr:GreA/GreB family elongation factor [Bdellovibrionales bacterium]